jgi:hypothetical protein
MRLVFFWGIGGVFSMIGTFLWKKSKHLKQKKGEEVLKEDKRKPILYLRSFLDDPLASKSENDSLLAKFLTLGGPQNLSSEEEQISFAINNFGPLIAIGNPSEIIPQLGASRISAEHSEWQDVVTDLIQASQLVILRVGETPGFWWEVMTVLNNKHPQNIAFLLPNTLNKYNEFKKRFESDFSPVLPTDYEPIPIRSQSFSAVLIFDSDWKSSIVYCKERSTWLFGNGLATDFKEIIQHILARPRTQGFHHFQNSRSQFQRTFLAEVQRIGGIVFLGLIISALLTGIVVGCCKMESVKAGSPTMLITWCITSIIVYFIVVRGEKLE